MGKAPVGVSPHSRGGGGPNPVSGNAHMVRGVYIRRLKAELPSSAAPRLRSLGLHGLGLALAGRGSRQLEDADRLSFRIPPRVQGARRGGPTQRRPFGAKNRWVSLVHGTHPTNLVLKQTKKDTYTKRPSADIIWVSLRIGYPSKWVDVSLVSL